MSEGTRLDRLPLDRSPEWAELGKHRAQLGEVRLRELFAADPQRGETYTLQVGDLYLDYSKHLVTDETLALLRQLAKARGVAELRDAMFRGDKINITEHRAVLHTALRAPRGAVIEVDAVLHLFVPEDAALPEPVERAAYRTVQEALTNVRKHAPGAWTEVSVLLDGDRLLVAVENGPAPAEPGRLDLPGGGHGIIGLRERATLLGGSLRAAPLPDGGFGVRLRVPVTAPAATGTAPDGTGRDGDPDQV